MDSDDPLSASPASSSPPPRAQRPDGRLSTSVVVCAYTEERWKILIKALESVRQQTVPPDQCLLVIDHNDLLLKRARTSIPLDVEVAPSEGPPGLSGARNTGVAHAACDIVVFLDDDVTARPTFLQELLEHYSDPAVAGVGGRALPLWPTGRPGWFPEEFDWVVGCSYRGLPEQLAPVRNLMGAAMSFRYSALAAAGPFDTAVGRAGALPLSCEETELSIRLRGSIGGAQLLYAPRATVDHTVSQDRASVHYFLRRCAAEGRSKALVAQRVGSDRALAAEREYTLRTLPLGLLRGLSKALRGDLDGLGCMAMIFAGFAATAAGYAVEALFLAASRWRRTWWRRAKALL